MWVNVPSSVSVRHVHAIRTELQQFGDFLFKPSSMFTVCAAPISLLLNVGLCLVSRVKKLLQPFGLRTVKSEGTSPRTTDWSGPSNICHMQGSFQRLCVGLTLVSELQLQVHSPSDRTDGLLLRLLLLRLLLLPPQSFRKKENICPPWKVGRTRAAFRVEPETKQQLRRMRVMMMMMEGSSSFCPSSVPLSDRHAPLLLCNFNEVLALASGGSSCEKLQ